MKKSVKNHLGFSLVEMIVAFAVLGIASLAIGGFFVSSSRSYSSSSSETGLQYEAQMALNQIEGKLIDATLGVNYNLYNGSHNFVETDTTVANLQSKILYIFDYKNSAFNALLVKWDIATEQLLYKEEPLNSFNEQSLVSSISLGGDWQLMAEGVKDFSVDLSKYKETKTVDVTLKLAKQRREFETSGTITLRNNVLVNTSKISDIYKNMSGATASRIDDVFLSANTNVTKPGGKVQLTTKVTGVYPSQEIFGWLIARSYDETQEVKLGQKNPADLVAETVAYVDSDKMLNVLVVPDNAVFDTLYVQAVVHLGNEQYKYSNVVTINVRNITGLTIRPTADLTVNGNGTLTQADIDKWGAASTGTMNATPAYIYPSNVIKMEQFVSGTFSTNDEIKIVWSVVEAGEGVVAKIDETTGTITVDRNSKQGRYIVKASVQGTDYWTQYSFLVSSPYLNNPPSIRVSAPIQMNRGQDPQQCTVKINDAAAYASDFDWSVRVETAAGQLVSGNPVSISANGLLTVTDALSFDYSYKITVYATMKSDSNLYGATIVTVPKVMMYLSTTEAITPRIGGTIPAGKIICTVSGLEHYDVQWTIAKETNPTYYFTAYGKTNITGAEVTMYPGTANERVVKTPKIVIGSDEPQTLSYVRAKATLVGHSNYSATLKLTIGQSVNQDIPDPSEPPVYEDVNPTIAFDALVPTLTNKDSITVSGVVEKPSSITDIVINGVSVTWDSDGNFSAPVAVTAGENEVTIVVTNSAGYRKVVEKTVFCDKEAPILSVEAPETTFTNLVTVTGTVSDNHSIDSVTVNGSKVDVINLDGSWTKNITVPSAASTITVVATDKATNTTTVTKNITYLENSNSFTLDKTIPQYTNKDSITVSGKLDLPAGVKAMTINGTTIDKKSDGKFSSTIKLDPGSNTIRIEVTSNKDEVNAVEYEIIYDSEKPTLNVEADGTTSEDKITVTGTVSDTYGVASLTVNGVAVNFNKSTGAWSAEINVGGKDVNIKAIATDNAGNTTTVETKVAYVKPNRGTYEITGQSQAVRNSSFQLHSYFKDEAGGYTPVNVDNDSWTITKVVVGGSTDTSSSRFNGITLVKQSNVVTVQISPIFRLENMKNTIEIYVSATHDNGVAFTEKKIEIAPMSFGLGSSATGGITSDRILSGYGLAPGSKNFYVVPVNCTNGDGVWAQLQNAGVEVVWQVSDPSKITLNEYNDGQRINLSTYYVLPSFSLNLTVIYKDSEVFGETYYFNQL